MTMASTLINNELKAPARSFLPDAISVAPFFRPLAAHLAASLCARVCVRVIMLVCFSDGSNAAMQYWMAEGEKGHHGKVYKIIWSRSAFLCTLRLCPSTSLRPRPHQVFGPRYKMVVSVSWSMLNNLPLTSFFLV